MKWKVTPVLMMLAVATAAMGLAACGSDSKPLTLTKDAGGGSAEIKVGQLVEVSLDGNPTTGYSWEVKQSGEPVLRPQGEPAYVQAETDGTVVGGGGTYTFTFVGSEAGTATLELIYHRSWETDVAPLETFTLEVTVK
ncbi:MAG TPA: protease inhibitor I42 family protein [Thermoleophilia bacterium]|nr:protease inhibitor I42 family protein [Thermoleophilia bacterium]